jgi:hypothetical protein
MRPVRRRDDAQLLARQDGAEPTGHVGHQLLTGGRHLKRQGTLVQQLEQFIEIHGACDVRQIVA